MIDVKPYSILPDDRIKLIGELIQVEFGEVELVQKIDWAKPTWSVIKYVNGNVASFCNLIERVILIDGKEYLAAGINNMITPRSYRVMDLHLRF